MRAPGRTRRTLVRITAGLLASTGLVVLGTGTPAVAAALNDCAATDNGSPRVDDITFTPSHVDVTDGPAQVRLDVRMHDTGGPGGPTGIRSAHVSIATPRPLGYQDVDLEHASGDRWTAQLTVPRRTAPGQWEVSQMWVADGAFNGLRPNSPISSSGAPFGAQLTVDSPTDEADPTFSDLDLQPRRLDTRRHAENVHVTVAAEDNGSGVAQVQVYAHRRHGPTVGADLQPDPHGTWSGDLRIPRWRADGTWRVDRIVVRDRADNRRFFRLRDISALDDPVFHVRSLHDAKSPRLRGLHVSPRRVDVRERARKVTFTAHLVDRGSGVAEARVLSWAGSVDLHRIRGSRTHGTWRGSVRVGPCDRVHGSRVAVHVSDRAGNLAQPSRAVRAPRHRDLTTPPVRAEQQRGLDPRGPFVLQFEHPVSGIDVDDAAVSRRGTAATDQAAPVVPGAWSCADASGRVSDCVTGEVTRAEWRPQEPLDPGGDYTVVLNPEHRLGVTDQLGNPYDRRTFGFRVG